MKLISRKIENLDLQFASNSHPASPDHYSLNSIPLIAPLFNNKLFLCFGTGYSLDLSIKMKVVESGVSKGVLSKGKMKNRFILLLKFDPMDFLFVMIL